MLEEKTQPILNLEVIALPPLKMVLVHAKEERLNREMLASIKNDALKSAMKEEHIEQQALMKIIEHLEKKP